MRMRGMLLGGALFCLLFLGGCGTDEVENNAFPLAVGVEPDGEEGYVIRMAYPDLQETDAKENALSGDVFWAGSARDLFAGADEMSADSSKNVDFNHLKMLVLDQELLASEQRREELVSFFMENKDAAWNTYVVFFDGDMGALFSDGPELGSSLGIYLEDMVEEWTNIRGSARTTVGDLVGQFYNDNETAIVPVLRIREEKPAVSSYVVVKGLECVCRLSREQACEILLARGQLKAFSFATEDDVRVTLHLITVERELSRVAGERMPGEFLPLLELRIRAAAQVKNRPLLSAEEKQELRRQAERELAGRLYDLAVTLQEDAHVDLADSFLLLPGYHRELWRLYASNRDAYEKKLQYRVRVELSQDEHSV